METVPMSLEENGCIYYDMAFIDDMRDKFRSLIGDGAPFNSVNHMATETGIEQKSLKRFLDGDGGLTMTVAARAFDMLGATIEIAGGQRLIGGTQARYEPSAFDVELRDYLNGLIRIQKKNVAEVAGLASHGDPQIKKRVSDFLEGKGPMFVGDLATVSKSINQHPEQIMKIVSELADSAENSIRIQQTLAG